VRYVPPDPLWMPGKEALDFIRKAVPDCSAADAIAQLRTAIVHRAVGARLKDMKRVPMGSSPIGVPSESNPRPRMWLQAEIRLNGSVRFDRKGPWRPFEVIRENVLRVWYCQPASNSDREQHVRARPSIDGICEAISALWPERIPAALRAKERDQRILMYLKERDHRVPQGSGLARAVQRALKAMKVMKATKQRA